MTIIFAFQLQYTSEKSLVLDEDIKPAEAVDVDALQMKLCLALTAKFQRTKFQQPLVLEARNPWFPYIFTIL